jgi:hypothetical protein
MKRHRNPDGRQRIVDWLGAQGASGIAIYSCIAVTLACAFISALK